MLSTCNLNTKYLTCMHQDRLILLLRKPGCVCKNKLCCKKKQKSEVSWWFGATAAERREWAGCCVWDCSACCRSGAAADRLWWDSQVADPHLLTGPGLSLWSQELGAHYMMIPLSFRLPVKLHFTLDYTPRVVVCCSSSCCCCYGINIWICLRGILILKEIILVSCHIHICGGVNTWHQFGGNNFSMLLL